MSANLFAMNSVSDPSVQPFLNRIGSVQWQSATGERIAVPFSELPPERQEALGRLMQLFLRSRPFLTHLQNHSGIYNIVYRDGENRIVIAGKTFELQELNEGDPDKEKPAKDLLTQVQGISEGVAITVDSLSIVRNTISAIATSALANPHSIVSLAVEGAGTVGGVAATAGGAIMVSKGIRKMANAKEDEEFNLGILQTVSGAGYLGMGLASLMYRVSSCFESAAGIAQGFLTFALNPALFFMNAGFTLWGLYQIAIAGSFRSELNQAIEKGGAKGGIDFLYNTLFLLTEQDQKEIDQAADPKEKEDKLKKILERNRAHLERRVGGKAAAEIVSEIEEVKRRFDDERILDGSNFEKAHALLDKALQGNYQELAKSALFVTLAILSIVSVAALGPTGTFAFCVALGILWLINDCTASADFTTERLWRIHQLVLSLIVVAIDGQDEEFMEYLTFLNPNLKSASPQVRAEAYARAFTDVEGEFYQLYRKIREEKDSGLFAAYLQMLREIRQMEIEGELNTLDACAEHLYSAAPLFSAWIVEQMPKEEGEEPLRQALFAFWPETDRPSNGTDLKRAALGMLEAIFDERDKYKNHGLIEAALSHFDAIKEGKEDKRNPLAQFMSTLVAADPALKLATNTDEARIAMQKYAKTIVAMYRNDTENSDAVKREAVFGRFSAEEVRAMLNGEEEGIPLMQLGCSLNCEFSSLRYGKTAYEYFTYPEFLTEDEREILQRHLEFRERASQNFPKVFAEAMQNPSLEGRSIQSELLIDLENLGTKVIQGEKISLPRQTITDFHRAPDTRFGNQVIPMGEKGGEQAILRLREMAKGDGRLFLFLAALYGQTAKNFSLYFQEELGKQKVLAGLYIPTSIVQSQSFIENEDGSFEVQYHFQFILTSEIDGHQETIPLIATYRLAKENGEWVCQNPIYSDTIESDGHAKSFDRLSRSSPF